jgi:hypothetical protein
VDEDAVAGMGAQRIRTSGDFKLLAQSCLGISTFVSWIVSPVLSFFVRVRTFTLIIYCVQRRCLEGGSRSFGFWSGSGTTSIATRACEWSRSTVRRIYWSTGAA